MSAVGGSGRWVVLLAVKPLEMAKSRLERPDRSAMTLAMAADTASAAASVDTVEAVLVISDDEQARALLSPLAAVVPIPRCGAESGAAPRCCRSRGSLAR